jgi:hypothetical protein
MKNYGLSKWQIEASRLKIQKNKKFLTDNGVHIDNKIVPFADFVCNSYMNADRYIAELQHRAWSVYDYARERALKNIFFTLTLPSEWHPKKTINQKLVSNPLFGGRKILFKTKHPLTNEKFKIMNCKVLQKIPLLDFDLDFFETVDKYTPRNASKELSKSLKRFLMDRSYTSINKQDRVYFRVTEPHKDGTPHIHVSLFVPEDRVDSIVMALKRLYPAPLGKVETNVESPVAYLMKYVLKTLDDLRDDSEKITNLTLWYLYHGICRFYTSRTFISLEVYRKLNGMYGLIDLTNSFHRGDVSVFQCTQTNKIVHIQNEFGTIYTQKPVNWFDKLVDTDHTYLDAEFETIYKDKEHKQVDLWIDGEKYFYFNGHYSKSEKKPHQMSDLELYDYFENLDIDTVEYSFYLHTRNLMIDRGLLDADKTSIIEDDLLGELGETTEEILIRALMPEASRVFL